jgi:hypothetical protein
VRLDVTEAQFTDTLIEMAMLRRWRVFHARPARTAQGWRTATQGHKGWPDLALARGGVFLGAELKTERGKPSDDQLSWLSELGDHGRLWRPRDIDEIEETLR